MSSANRPTSKGGKGSKSEKAHKVEKIDTGKGDKHHYQGGGNENVRSKSDDPGIKEKVKQIIEMTQRSEEEVCLALHECDNDTEQAINMLFESVGQGEWETSVKKKKNRQASASKMEAQEGATGDEWNENQTYADKEKTRNKTGGPPRIHGRHNDNRGWRGREKQENERNLEDGSGGRSDHRERRGRPGGPTRGGGGRGRGGGRAGGRFPPRNRGNYSNTRPIETWDNSTTWNSTITNTNHAEETWDEFPSADDWSTEEYTGSLADTKVFTPSVQQEHVQMDGGTDPNTGTTPIPAEVSDLTSGQQQQLNQSLDMRTQLPPQSQTAGQQMVTLVQTQYINQLNQQNTESIKVHQQYNNMTQVYSASNAQGYGTTPPQNYDKSAGQVFSNETSVPQVYSNSSTQQYGSPTTYVNSTYPVSGSYGGAADPAPPQPVRTKTQRARVPPPSKIPASAVEMPGDINSSIGYLDVQFGAMDFMSDSSSFEGVPETKFGSSNNSNLDSTSAAQSSNIDLNSSAQSAPIDAYSPSKPNTQSSISSALTQSLSNTDSIPQTSEHVPNTYNTTSRSSTGSTATQSVTPSGLDLNKQTEAHSYTQSSNYNSYQPKSSSYQTQYSSTNYNTTQTTTNSYVSNQGGNNFVNSNTGSYNPPNAGNTYQNAYSSTSSYQTNANAAAFPPITQPNSYPANNQSYQQTASQSTYGANTGLNNSSNYGSATSSTNQYNSYNSASNHKLVKDGSAYDGSTTAVSSTGTTTSSVNSTSTALSLTQTSTTGTKAMNTLTKNSSVVSNIHPGVTPVMSTTPYLVTGQVPYFQQPIYSYEEMQLLQQRIPHMTTPYYDMSYQTPTTLAAVRDGALANVAYSISDARFTRADNNASPVPSTLSQQTNTLTQGHQATPILAQTGHPFYFPSTYNPMTPSYQFVYPQMPTATNAHGSSNSNQYPKPGTYGSGYGSGYDALSQSQDYSKGGYVGNAQGQNKASGANATSTGTTGNDLSVAMYGKSHAALGKVNSYEKQGFHSGTPPPFTGALHGNQNAGLAPSGTGYGPQMYIPTMTPHQQHHSTPLMHQVHQDSGNSTGQRTQASNQGKSGSKQGYPTSYWNQA